MDQNQHRAMPRLARGRRARFFEADGVDELISMVLELTAEVSTLRERQYALEKVLEQNNLPVRNDVEAWQPDQADEAHLAADRERLLSTVLRTLEGESDTLLEPADSLLEAEQATDRSRAA